MTRQTSLLAVLIAAVFGVLMALSACEFVDDGKDGGEDSGYYYDTGDGSDTGEYYY
jgi:predicted outer membrane lipoprotein